MTPDHWQRACELFHAALEQPTSRVDEFLRTQCGDDEELYVVVRGMVEERTRSGWLDRPVLEFIEDSKRVFVEGQLVSGRYRIVRFVGRGGMGEVYEALDLELNERIALKTLLPSIAGNDQMIAQFKQEIQLTRKIGHPNVCRVFDLARDPGDGSRPNLKSGPVVFLTMEFLDGETLAARLQREGRIPFPAAWPIMEQVAQGLDAAHGTGVIHRDLKPSNVMLVPRAVITDFGLARNLPRSPESTVTLEEKLIGTLDYMAPELLTTHRATVASDIYALGMLGYKTVTGRLPFAEDPPLNAAILRSRVPVPAPRSLVPDLDPAWDRAILRALDPDPARRFSTAGALVGALRGESRSVSLPLPVMTRRRWIGAGVLAGGLTAASVSWWEIVRLHSRPPAEAANFYRLGVDDIHAGAYFAATKALDQAVRLAPQFSMAHARLAEAWNELDLTERAGQEMLVSHRGDLSSLESQDRLQLEAIDLTITREFESAASKYEQIRRYVKADDAGFQVDLGRAYEKAGQPVKAMESYHRAAEGPAHDPAAWLRLAVLYSRSADAAKTAEAFQQAETLYQITSNQEGLTEVALQRGISANARGLLDDGAGYLEKARETARTAGNIHQEIQAELRLGTNAYLAGDAGASERYAREALATAQANGMPALAARGLVGLGNSYFRREDYKGAEKYYQDALTLARPSGSRLLEALALLSLASAHNLLRRSDDSAREAKEALQFFQANHFARESLQCLTLVGRAQSYRGDFDGAIESYRQALEMAEKVQDRFQMALAHESMGEILADQEKYPESLQEYQQNLALSTDDEHVGYAALQCANMLWRLGRYAEASTMHGKADARAEKFPLLRTKVARSRSEMALSQNRYMEAAALSRRVLGVSQEPVDVAIATRVIGLALLRAGQTREGLRTCEESAGTAAKLGDVFLQVPAQLALAEAHLESGDPSGALSVVNDALPGLVNLPDSRWRALILAARADRDRAREHAAAAKQQLDAIASQWGEAAFALYIKRPDLQQVLWRVSRIFPANYK
jgi:tetratricopeptide (TPR) repeat protein